MKSYPPVKNHFCFKDNLDAKNESNYQYYFRNALFVLIHCQNGG